MKVELGTIKNYSIVDGFLPESAAGAVPAEACERLARNHYENFTVGSFLLPRGLRRHVYNIYAYCRVCDDLADETGDPELSLRLLEWWRDELFDCYRGKPHHPIFHALSETIEEYNLPLQPFNDLINAFVQDQRVTRYASYEDLLSYCARSANPVGRLFLCLLGYRDRERWLFSDSTCTALQLTNFWQDIPVDYAKGRIYIPQEDMERFGYTEDELRNSIVNASFVRLLRFEICRTRELFEHGAKLQCMVSGKGSADIGLFTAGGMALLRSIERSNYNVFRRITVSKLKKTALIAAWVAKHLLSFAHREG